MKIETKLNHGDSFFALDKGKIKEHVVSFISATTSSDVDKPVRVAYFPVGGTGSYTSTTFEESDVFKTKDELLKHIQS